MCKEVKIGVWRHKGWHNWTAYLLVWVVSFCHKFSCRQCPRIPVVFPGGVPDILLVCNKENTEYNKDTDFCMLVFGVPNLAFSGSSVGFFWYAVKREKLTGEFVYDIAVVTHCWKWTLNRTAFFFPNGPGSAINKFNFLFYDRDSPKILLYYILRYISMSF